MSGVQQDKMVMNFYRAGALILGSICIFFLQGIYAEVKAGSEHIGQHDVRLERIETRLNDLIQFENRKEIRDRSEKLEAETK